MSLNLEDIINRAISIAQASGQAKRDNALKVAEMSTEAYRDKGANDLQIANIAAGTDRYKADASAKIADTNLRGDMYKGDAQVQAANLGLVGRTVDAGATAYGAELRAAQPVVSGIVKAQSEMEQYPEGASDDAKKNIDRNNHSRNEFVKTAANDPQYLRAAGNKFDAVSAAQSAASGLGVRLGPVGVQEVPPRPVAINRTLNPAINPASSYFPTPRTDAAVAAPLGAAAVPTSPLRAGTQDPTRLGYPQDPTKTKVKAKPDNSKVMDPRKIGIGVTDW